MSQAASVSTTPRAFANRWQFRAWIWPPVLAGFVLLLYAPVLRKLAWQWWNDPEYGHGFFIPLLSGYVLWRERGTWLGKIRQPSNFGLLVMSGAVALLVLGSLGAELFISRVSLVVLLAGMILYLAGREVLRAVSFPVGYLLFMIPIPVIVYNQITFPLQLLASRFAAFCLDLVHVPVLRDGNILMFSDYSLEIVEACSGIRSLLTLISLAVAYGYFLERRVWVRVLLALLMIPGAILSNAIRIMGAGAMAYKFGPDAAAGFLHEFSSWVIFLTSLLLMFFFHWILRHIGSESESAAPA